MRRETGLDALQVRAPLARRTPVPRPRRRLAPPVLARARAALLLRRPSPPEEEQLIAEARSFALSLPTPVRLQICRSLDGAHAYIYAWMEPAALDACQASEPRAAPLEPLAEWEGAGTDDLATYHYVVATDVDAGDEADFNRWYDTEHMPGLAGVAGTVHCARLRSRDGAPRYHACYDITSPQLLEGGAWLALRHTPWSTQVRRQFRNPRRLMFRTLLDERRLAVSGAYF